MITLTTIKSYITAAATAVVMSMTITMTSLSVYGANGLRSSVHWPVHGDRIEKVHCEFTDADVDANVWDFSRTHETGTRHDVLWLNYGDTLLTRIENGSQMTYRCSNDTVFLISAEDKLIRLSAKGNQARIWPEICTHDIAGSTRRYEGTFGGGNNVDTKSALNVTVLGEGCLILQEDTLYNVKRIRTEVTQTINVTPGLIGFSIPGDTVSMTRDSQTKSADSLLHTVIKDRWYSDSYRYELVENIIETYSWAGRDIIARKTTCLISPEAQEYQFGVLNTRQGKQDESKGGESNMSNGSITLADNLNFIHKGNEVSVNFSSANQKDGTYEISLLLFDSVGRVWHKVKDGIKGGYWSNSVAIDGLPPGNYVLTVSLDSQKKSYKFSKD